MAQSDFWSEGRILIAGDSRVRRLMSNSDPVLSKKVDYAFEGGVLIDDLVVLVNDNLNDLHKVIILFGMIGDEMHKYIHHVSPEISVSLIRSKECDASEKILTTVKESSAKWMSLRSDRMVVWMIPHYVDYLSYNEGKLGEYDIGDALEISLESSRRFVDYITRLKLRWVAENSEVPFGLLNRVLFAGRKAKPLYNSFGAVSAADYKFPLNLLTDGLHPTSQFAKEIWQFLHKTVSESHERLSGRRSIIAPSESTSEGSQRTVKLPSNKRGKFQFQKPYVPKRIKLDTQKSSVYSRLSQPTEEEEYSNLSYEEPSGSFRNLSWKSPSISSHHTTKAAPIGYVQRGLPSWSWALHNQRINAVKVEVYTQGLESQKRAEGRLADIIRDRGLKAAEQGQFDTVNAASRSWLKNLHSEMNSPAPDAKLVQKEIAKLLPVEDSKSSSSDSD